MVLLNKIKISNSTIYNLFYIKFFLSKQNRILSIKHGFIFNDSDHNRVTSKSWVKNPGKAVAREN